MALIEGTVGGEILNGGADDDQIFGFGGNDGLNGGGGNDSLEGGAGNDGLGGEFGNDTLSGGEDDDSLDGGAGDDHLIGGAGNDSFRDNLAGVNTLEGGAGDDRFEVAVLAGGAEVTNTAIGGSGQDTYVLGGVSFGATLQFTVTDFGVGAEKDLIDLDFVLGFNSIGYTGGNPFALGYFQLVASGSDTLLQWDHDGPDDGSGSEDGWVTQLFLKDVLPGQITGANFVGGIPPDGSTVPGQDITGGGGNDTLVGAFFNDQISGLEGNDRLEGKGGNDALDGGPGNDILLGSFGNDTVLGGDGDDSFDLFHSGHQQFSDSDTSHGDDHLVGGAGNDRLADHLGINNLEGNEGNDLFLLVGGSGGNATTMTGGTGQDTYALDLTAFGIFGGNTDYIVMDFGVGAEKDLLDITSPVAFAAAGGSFTGGNPFDPALGFARLIQSGGDTLLQFDHDGAAGTEFEWATQVTLKNVLPVQITAANIVEGIRPDGSPSGPGQTLTGTSFGNTLTGGFDHDAISGLDGNDRLDGGWGNDRVDGGRGHDDLKGGFGNDTLIGGAGNDAFGAEHTDGSGDDHLIGGAGDDYFEDGSGINIIEGGDGADTFVAAGGAGSSSTVTGGEGRDTYVLGGLAHLLDTLDTGYTATDFAVGTGGDRLNIDGLLVASGNGGGYAGGDPFVLGYLRLLQSGPDTLVQWDRDGAAGVESDWITQLRLQDVSSSSITPGNFTGRLLVGSADDDLLVGGLGNDTIRGQGGNDTLDGSVGRDALEGGSGDDVYFVDHAGDEVIERSNSPVAALVLPGAEAGLAGVSGITDAVIAAVNYSLANFRYVENITLTGAARVATGNALANMMIGSDGADTLNGAAGKDSIEGGSGSDKLVGGAGNDRLDGGEGNDRLLGGTENDVFLWSEGDDTIDGGGGSDTLKVISGNLDLVALENNRIVNIETIDLTGDSGTVLTLLKSDVLALSTTTDVLKVLGDDGDQINAAGFTARGGPSDGFQTYKNGIATLLVDVDIDVNPA
jgi:Ca2+-binding RTX toxin-like protein